ncbi:MAG: sel1 repeat family protein, partial [Burkholderiaceae bacterium]|nr:sel1 repeat family protein [Burkholderiaceae bacterium]
SMYCQGIGVEQDHGAAVKWYRMAAEQGDAIAQFNLAVSYVKGLGVTRDLGKAHMWLSFSARYGDRQAAAGLDKLANHMTALQLDEARQLAFEYEASRALPHR